jgi:hypothetical protein
MKSFVTKFKTQLIMVKMGTSSYMFNNSMTMALDSTFVKIPISLIA